MNEVLSRIHYVPVFPGLMFPRVLIVKMEVEYGY